MNVLIIDDDKDVLLTAKLILKKHFTKVEVLSNPKHIKTVLEKETFQAIALDMNFKPGESSGEEGLYWLKEIRETSPETQVVINTAYGEIDLAVKAMKSGAFDFLVKPWKEEKLLSTIFAAAKHSMAINQINKLSIRQKIQNDDLDARFKDIVSKAPAMKPVFKTVDKVAKTDANVLILGENGVGKELIARAIHRNSNRSKESFINIDLGALSENLFESELFGHCKGAFTDAKEDRTGRFEAASGGTLFLDEIGNLSLGLQAKLLQALQNKKITKVGSNKEIPVDIRLICATNMPVYEMVTKKQFRQDLLYRINTIEIKLPPLRNRKEDIPLLARYFLEKIKKKYHKHSLTVSDIANNALTQHYWPGNVRELEHAVERAVIMCDTDILEAKDFLFLNYNIPIIEAGEKGKNEDEALLNVSELEKMAIRKSIFKNEGNLSKAAGELGMGRTTLYRKMKKYNL